VCCLLDAGQLADFPVTLPASTAAVFRRGSRSDGGRSRPSSFAIALLQGRILPFLRSADGAGERVVVHCWGGNGERSRPAAWLVASRGLSPKEALETVEAYRDCEEAVLAGNATLDELVELLARCAPSAP